MHFDITKTERVLLFSACLLLACVCAYSLCYSLVVIIFPATLHLS